MTALWFDSIKWQPESGPHGPLLELSGTDFADLSVFPAGQDIRWDYMMGTSNSEIPFHQRSHLLVFSKQGLLGPSERY